MKKSLEGFNSSFEQEEGRIGEPKDRVIEIIQSEEQNRGRWWRGNEEK